MKKIFFLTLLTVLHLATNAQCSLCTRNAQQIGDKAGAGLNLSILFLAFTPLILIGYIGYRWYKSQKENKE